MLQILLGKNLTEKLRVIDHDKELQLKSVDSLTKEISSLNIEIDRLKSKKKIEEEDIKHMLKLQEERMSLEKEKFKVQMEREKDAAIAKVKDEYRDKLEQFLVQKNKESDQRFTEILARLPDVNMSITQGRKGK